MKTVRVASFSNDKAGFPHHAMLGKAYNYLGKGWTDKAYTMIGNGHPMVFRSPQKGMVSVEVYQIPETRLKAMDHYYGDGCMVKKGIWITKREMIKITLNDGSTIDAWFWIADNKYKPKTMIFPLPNTPEGYEWLGYRLAA